MLPTNRMESIAELATKTQLTYYELHCEGNSNREIASICGKANSSVNNAFKLLEEKAVNANLMQTDREQLRGSAYLKKPDVVSLPKKGKIKRMIFTSAQNNTRVNKGVWANIKALAEHYDAEIHVSQFTYAAGNSTHSTAQKVKGKSKGSLKAKEVTYDPLLEEYTSNNPLQVCHDLTWCGELNISPTAVNPLSGMDSYTRQSSSIFPHSKIALQCVATMKGTPAKFMYTTGCVTERNYIPKKAGLKASFHHTYGALLVEFDHNGKWFARQLNADNDNTIYDLEVVSENGTVYQNEGGFEAFNPGDIHAASLDELCKEAIWGSHDSVVDVMRPGYVFLHDVLDARARNHHDIRDPHKTFKKYVNGQDGVEDEIQDTADLVQYMDRVFCQLVVAESNHDQAITRWLKETDYKTDPRNAVFYLRCTLAIYEAMEAKDDSFHLIEYVMRLLGVDDSVRFLRMDESFIVLNTECGMHGHAGLNGSRGSAIGFKKMSSKINVGHTHTAGIVDGVFTAGMNGDLNQDYANGPSSWSASDIGMYENGKRVIITKRLINNEMKWRL